jgi:hypothetical protein
VRAGHNANGPYPQFPGVYGPFGDGQSVAPGAPWQRLYFLPEPQ